MKNSFIITNGATKNLQAFNKSQAALKKAIQIKKLGGDPDSLNKPASLIDNRSLVPNLILQDKRPSARDGHTGIIWTNSSGDQTFLIIFGGDRHGMPFNDLHVLDFGREFKKTM